MNAVGAKSKVNGDILDGEVLGSDVLQTASPETLSQQRYYIQFSKTCMWNIVVWIYVDEPSSVFFF